MPVKVSYPGYSSEAEYRVALAEQLVQRAAYEAANDSRFDATIQRLAPIINQLREDPAGRSTRKLAERLNEMGTTGPNGKPLSYGTMRRILERLPELHLGEGPSNRKRAASDRRMPYRYRPGRQSGFTGLKNTLADVAKAATVGNLDHSSCILEELAPNFVARGGVAMFQPMVGRTTALSTACESTIKTDRVVKRSPNW